MEHNATDSSYTLGHNHMSDWSPAEYKHILGYVSSGRNVEYTTLDTRDNAESINWVELGAVTPVKNQASCGSCWAFSTTGSLEGAHFVATGELVSFSEEQLVECNIGTGNMGCQGGLQSTAYEYYETGIDAMLEDKYPYTSGGGSSGDCKYDASEATNVTVSAYTNVTPSSVDQMKAGLTQQPVAVAIQANKLCFQFYKSGVMDKASCGTNLDHAVLAVGYGTEDGKDYWLVKNSWDTVWGDNGYIKLAIVDGDGICGVQMEPLFPKTN